jgi:hypothetical protein
MVLAKPVPAGMAGQHANRCRASPGMSYYRPDGAVPGEAMATVPRLRDQGSDQDMQVE